MCSMSICPRKVRLLRKVSPWRKEITPAGKSNRFREGHVMVRALMRRCFGAGNELPRDTCSRHLLAEQDEPQRVRLRAFTFFGYNALFHYPLLDHATPNLLKACLENEVVCHHSQRSGTASPRPRLAFLSQREPIAKKCSSPKRLKASMLAAMSHRSRSNSPCRDSSDSPILR